MPLTLEEKRKRQNERSARWRARHPEKYRENYLRYSKSPERRAKLKAWYRANPERQRGYTLKYRWGLSVPEVAAMLEAQGNCCKICKRPESGKRGWAVDHCHTTNKVRGLLCNSCNTGLGCFKDNPKFLAAAIEYLS